MQTFQTKRVAELADIPKNRLQQWVFKGIIIPVKESPGHGMAGKFNLANIIEVKLVKDFYAMGLPLKRAGRLARRVSAERQVTLTVKARRIKLTINVETYREEILNQI